MLGWGDMLFTVLLPEIGASFPLGGALQTHVFDLEGCTSLAPYTSHTPPDVFWGPRPLTPPRMSVEVGASCLRGLLGAL